MTTKDTHCIRNGDYFYYSWKTGLGPSTDPYWCRDRKCVARTDKHGDIVLVDTWNYWPYSGEEDTNIFTYEGLSREYSKYINLELFDLDFICNLNDYEFVSPYCKDDYEGVISVGYQCTKKWAKPKGVDKSRSAILKKLQEQLEDAEYQKKSACWDIERIQKEIQELKGIDKESQTV